MASEGVSSYTGLDAMKRNAPATLRNREPILHVLRDHLPKAGTILEVASGTGEHVTFFGSHFPSLSWQPSEIDTELLASIRSWIAETGLNNIREPIVLDVEQETWLENPVEAILCINMLHISPWTAGRALLRGSGKLLHPEGTLYLYGPFNIDGQYSAPSNAEFDGWLKSLNAAYGIRDLDRVSEEASANGLERVDVIEMPANNLSVVFKRVTAKER